MVGMEADLTIGDERSNVSKSLAVLKSTILVHVEGVNRGGRRKVATVETEGDAGVCNIDLLSIRTEANTCSSQHFI